MKFNVLILAGSAAAFAPGASSIKKSSALAFSIDTIESYPWRKLRQTTS